MIRNGLPVEEVTSLVRTQDFSARQGDQQCAINIPELKESFPNSSDKCSLDKF
jgi:hypothetical protein